MTVQQLFWGMFLWGFFNIASSILVQLLYSHNPTIQIYRCREIRNTDDSPLFRYGTFINFLTLVFRHEERETQFLLYWLFLHRPQSPLTSWTVPAQSEISTNVFFKVIKFSANRFRAWRHSHPSPIYYVGFFLWHLWLSYLLCASVNCTQCVSTSTKSRIVESPTKPNDKI